jgi:hypothetical protein
MATVLEEYTTEDQCSLVRFIFVGKSIRCKGYSKRIFSVYGGKCFSRKAVYNWIEKRGKGFADDEVVEAEVRK